MVQNELAALTMVEMKKRDMKVIVTIIIVVMITINVYKHNDNGLIISSPTSSSLSRLS